MTNDPGDPADLFDAHAAPSRSDDALTRLREAELRHAEQSVRLAEREADVAALQRRVALLTAEAAEAQRVIGEQRQSEAAVRAERDAAAQELQRTAARLAEVQARAARLQEELARTPAPQPSPAPAPDPAGDAQLDELRRQLDALRAERDAVEASARVAGAERLARIRELEQLVSGLTLTLAATRKDIARTESSRAWRLGHGVTRTASRVMLRPDKTQGALQAALRRIDEFHAATRVLPPAPKPPPGRAAPAPAPPAPAPPTPTPPKPAPSAAVDRRTLGRQVRERLGDVPTLEQWPGVSIVVPTRDGRALLERLIDGLREHTDYPLAELIVVDNGSGDGTAEWLANADAGLPIRVLANAENQTFSAASTQGAEAASHPLVLLLNNDVEPFESGWLRELVAAHVLGANTLTGATLLHADRPGVVQHHVIRMRAEHGRVRPYNAGDGDDVFGAGFGVEQQAAAVSAACLLVDRTHLAEIGGLSGRYRYGLEDVDLGLRVTAAGGRVVGTGRSLVLHAESSSRTAEGLDFTRANREVNRRALLERWGPSLRGEYRRARLAGDRAWTDGRGPHAVIVITTLDPTDGWGDWYTGHELGDALVADGWQVSYLAQRDERAEVPADADYVITLLDRFDARRVPLEVPVIAWIRNWADRWIEQPWFWRLDVLLASSRRIADVIADRTGRTSSFFPLATNPARFAVGEPAAARSVDAVFTGNHWGEDRAIQPALVPERGQTIVVHGRGWEKVSKVRKVAQGPVEYDDLPAVYADARLVLDDTAGPTLQYDAVNSRVFDALAAGSLPLTNCGGGVRELFDEDFPVWRDAAQLRALTATLLGDDAKRVELAARYRGIVLREHTYAHRARELRDVLGRFEQLPSFCLKIGAPNWEQAERWGDLHFARALERELRRRGHRVVVQVLEEWEEDAGLTYDVVLHLKGLSRHYAKPGQLNVLWCISHPDELTGEECDGYDLVAIASEKFAAEMRERTSTPVIVVEQATDPRVFYPDPDESLRHDVVYVANSRGVLRTMMRDLLPTDLDLAVYGSNWDGLIDTKHVVAEHVPNEELRRIYSSAKVVLADHWDDMWEWGFISNRIHDAVACGAVVVSDDVAGLAGRFGNQVLTYTRKDELRAVIDRALAMGSPGKSVVPNRFADVVDRFLSAVGERLPS